MYIEDENVMYLEDKMILQMTNTFMKLCLQIKLMKCISYASFMTRCDLFNSLKGNYYFIKYDVGLILEVKEIITSKN